MSAYGHEMEREYSAPSLSSREGSERGSNYMSETGIFMSSFAATIFISGLITVGVSLVSLLIALTVMLQSCETRSAGVLQMYKYKNNYDYCRNFALHAELNSLGAKLLPSICKDVDTHYVKEGQYRKDLNITVSLAEDFLSNFRRQHDGKNVVLMDVDDLFPQSLFTSKVMNRIKENPLHDSSKEADYLKYIFVRKLYLKLQSDEWPLILFSRKPEKLRNATEEFLVSVGCRGWFSLIMREENEMQMGFEEFISRRRIMLQREDLQIIAVISSQMDGLRGPSLGRRIFKVPSPMFKYSMEDHAESQIQKS